MKFCSGQAFIRALRESEGKNVSREDIFERAYQIDDAHISRNKRIRTLGRKVKNEQIPTR